MRRKTRFGGGALAAWLATSVAVQAQTTVRLEEVLAIGGPDSETLIQWTGVATDGDGAIYVLDAMDFALKKFDARGRLLGRTGRQGQGPGEFSTPRWLAVAGERVYAIDQSVFGVLVFGRNLAYQKTLPLPSMPDGVEVWPDRGLAVVVNSYDSPGKILFFDPDGQPAAELRYMEKVEGLLLDKVTFVLAPDGGIYIGYLFQDKVERWTLSGGRSWSRNLFGGKKSETTTVQGFSLPRDTFVFDIALDSRGRVYVLGGKRAKNHGRDVAILDASGALVGALTLPEPSHCLHFDNRDFLYVRADQGVTLKKYRLVFP
ncbi:MAG: hypothetical protein FJY80_09150 [Candidatus Aminicenantes bacterium]|nr:hypothetical protein [Candidatus Aminicenantes bacterium]